MSHNPWALLDDEVASEEDDDMQRTPSASPPAVTAASMAGASATQQQQQRADSPTVQPGMSRKEQKKIGRKAKRQRHAADVRALSQELLAQFKRREAGGGAAAGADDAAAAEEQSGDDDDEEDEADNGAGGDDDNVSVQTGSTGRESTTSASKSAAPSEVGLTTTDLASCVKTLGLLTTHTTLLEHPSLRQVRSALAPIVERLAVQWKIGRTGTAAVVRKALKRTHKDMLSSKELAQREYEQALDSAARNATGMRAQRLQKLESLNSLVDGEAMDEEAAARRALLKQYRVPDGVAITDGSSQDVCMQLLTDGGSSHGNKRQKLLTAGGAAASSSSAAASSSSAAASAAAAAPTKLLTPIKCYICKSMFRTLHHFYDSLCPACAGLNYQKRELRADLSGKIVLLTGARVKIGYRVLLVLLRCGAFVVATTRFPHDLSRRLQLEHDFSRWQDRVHIYGLDFRNLTVLEEFVARMYKNYSHLDAIINNACQTVRRPPAYYTHLLEGERAPLEKLDVTAQKMLQHHHAFANDVHLGNTLEAGEGMRRLESGSGVDVSVPAVPDAAGGEGARPSPAALRPPPHHPARPNAGVTIVEEITVDDEEDKAAEEIVAGLAGKGAPAPAAAAAAVDKPPTRNPAFKRASSDPVGSSASASAASSAAAAGASTAAVASAAASGSGPGQMAPKPKRSRRAAMRAAAAPTEDVDDSSSSTLQQLVPHGSNNGDSHSFLSPSTLAAESTQLSLLPSDSLSPQERERLFPQGARDINGQQLDLRATNSWTMKLSDVPIGEAAEVMAINCLAPFLLNSKLKALMVRGNEGKQIPRFIVNVSAMEGKFYRFKSSNHPHTNAAKAALNMMTRTSAQDYVRSNIFMTAVDTGWINDENPLPKAASIAAKYNFQTPLDEVDAAMRVLDPILAPLQQMQADPKLTIKSMRIPWGYFIKDYQKCEW